MSTRNVTPEEFMRLMISFRRLTKFKQGDQVGLIDSTSGEVFCVKEQELRRLASSKYNSGSHQQFRGIEIPLN